MFGGDADAFFTSCSLHALLLIGPIRFSVNQVAFQAGGLSASLPAITAVDPLASIILGVLLYDEKAARNAPGSSPGQSDGRPSTSLAAGTN